jgi:hypothetical protein
MVQLRIETEIEATPEEVRAIVCNHKINVLAPNNHLQDS